MQCNLSTGGGRGSNVLVLHFVTTHQTAPEMTSDQVGNSVSGYITEMQKCGNAYTPADWTTKLNSEYHFRLRPLGPVDRLLAANKSRLVHIRWTAIDPTLTGSAHQHAATLGKITDSITSGSATYTKNDAYMQTRFRFSAVGGWQPNWFRPSLQINGDAVVFGGVDRPRFDGNAGDRSMGLDMPMCFDGDWRYEKIHSIKARAPLGQYIVETDTVQQYVVQLTLIFILEDEG